MSFFSSPDRPLIIAGPCSAETREQVLETASALSKMPVSLFRAGIWKPRTKPGSFEGSGVEALPWLKEVKEQFKLPVAIEVAETAHIEQALKHDIDVLWIGARTTVNPFHVQRLADALKGVQVPVMVKNPVNPDIDLWQGAIERFEHVGIKDVAAIHRGFSGYNTATVYRNHPNWPIPIELKRRRPALPIICDPSHIAGERDKVYEVAQKAMDMHLDGLMIETHPQPEKAWSDAAQQMTPQALAELINKLVIRKEYTENMSSAAELDYLRQLMDSLDTEIIDLLAERMELSERMGAVKKASNMTVYQPDRWREIVETRTAHAFNKTLPADFIIRLYEIIHDESIKRQLTILQEAAKEVKK